MKKKIVWAISTDWIKSLKETFHAMRTVKDLAEMVLTIKAARDRLNLLMTAHFWDGYSKSLINAYLKFTVLMRLLLVPGENETL